MRRFINIVEGETLVIRPPDRGGDDAPALLFMKELWEITEPHPFMRNERIYGWSVIEARRSIDHPINAVYIKAIQAVEAGKGHGKEALKMLCELADEHGVTLELNAKPFGQEHLSAKQLVAWYTRSGFTVVRRGNAESGTDMIRKPHHAINATPLDENDTMPDIVYHGTTLAGWEHDAGDGTMFFTSNREDAQNYAEEAAVAEHYRNGSESDELDASVKPIIVSFKLEDLKKLEGRGAELQPDWGWLDGQQHAEGDTPTWVESFQHVGSFCIAPFKHEFKALGSIANAF